MNCFWKRVITITPPFGGSDKEAADNIQSHKWRVLKLSTIYSESSEDWPTIVHCADCDVVADSEASKYPCGTAPKPVTLRDWRNRRR